MRLKAIFRRIDFRPSPFASESDADELFAAVTPGHDGVIADDHAGIAIAALSPKIAYQLAAISKVMALDLEFSQKADLRELAIQTANLKCGSNFSFNARIPACIKAGLTPGQIAALPDWRSSPLFSPDQKLVLEYSSEVFERQVSDTLLQQFVAVFGEKCAIECAALVGLWSCWAMVIDVAQPTAFASEISR